ncbi:MAG: hypothetical protein R3194_13185, partial [Limnobacter sp.]|nr:hypothetical protein [Limnobacter sp.]
MTTHFSKYLGLLLIFLTGCTTYAQFTSDYRTSMANGNYNGALEKLDDARKGGNELLYLLETGLIAHYQGRYRASNRYFEMAERLSDELFAKSISREAAALVTNDAVRKYRGETFEMVAIHYYRALNYWHLDLPESALVECRKANQKLAQYAIHNGETTYKNDAFIHYMTGLFYEATGEYNDAYISYQHARDAYAHYAETFNLQQPPGLNEDLARVETIVTGEDTDYRFASLNPSLAPVGNGELVIFTEIGFVPRKVQAQIDLPIYESDIKRSKGTEITVVAHDISGRYYSAHRVGNVEYWLRVALPKYETAIPRSRKVLV